MKRKAVILSMILFCLFSTAGCQNQSESPGGSSSETSQTVTQEAQAKFEIKKDEEQLESKEISFHTDQSLLAILEKHFDVEVENGLIVSINGVSQDEGKGYYWTFTINDEWGEKGAEETFIKDGDQIVFTYGKF
ncbi:hypothetical protein NRIC_31090 [Enterococcus florum]|uniref:Transcobalamin-like C-terminal domain-containing protein n=1 Tax=Enterococcus florum TaxID=2480627 RepID=A0A4P5PG10_9ENTE|nr:DUF4430 domain-containing protein [Enterococcus florum]GCF95218.1 hypothetical protein NRIC_31090 [Enterococcus florum]